jgi:hypothetical protein
VSPLGEGGGAELQGKFLRCGGEDAGAFGVAGSGAAGQETRQLQAGAGEDAPSPGTFGEGARFAEELLGLVGPAENGGE